MKYTFIMFGQVICLWSLVQKSQICFTTFVLKGSVFVKYLVILLEVDGNTMYCTPLCLSYDFL